MISQTPKMLKSWRYTVEPGIDECREFLKYGTGGGGIGSLDGPVTKYYDYYGNDDSFGSLRHFLNTLDTVKDDVIYYYSCSYGFIKDYVIRYLSLFVSESRAIEIANYCEQHSRTHQHDEEARFLRRTVAVGTRFFNEVFYESSWMVLEELFPLHLRQDCMNWIKRNRVYPIPTWKKLIVELDSDSFEFDTPLHCMNVTMAQDQKTIGQPWRITCSSQAYEESFKPFILFVSNWTLLLLCLLAGEKFGQVAFGIYWETGPFAERRTYGLF